MIESKFFDFLFNSTIASSTSLLVVKGDVGSSNTK